MSLQFDGYLQTEQTHLTSTRNKEWNMTSTPEIFLMSPLNHYILKITMVSYF